MNKILVQQQILPLEENNQYDALVIGGGPGGTTVAALLAKAGKRVALFERDNYPKFHIGESLLAATVPIFERLGVHELIKEKFICKPGGKWFYDDVPVYGEFKYCDPNCVFHDYPYAYMVQRAAFDKILEKNAENAGAEIYFPYQVSDDFIYEGTRLVGLKVKGPTGKVMDVYGKMIFDCSGQRALIANKLKLRYENTLKRMAIFSHYRAKAIDPELINGWFVGQMIDDGWIWLIPLEDDKISVGAVINIDQYRKAKSSPEEFLENIFNSHPVIRNGISADAQRIGDVHILGNLGYTSKTLCGDGWVLVGDAGFFIDPCYSSGVHMAMSSAEKAADTFLQGLEKNDLSSRIFQKYQKQMKHHEKMVSKFVEVFYLCSKNRTLRNLIPKLSNDPASRRKFGTFVGGDFSKNGVFINITYFVNKMISRIFP